MAIRLRLSVGCSNVASTCATGRSAIQGSSPGISHSSRSLDLSFLLPVTIGFNDSRSQLINLVIPRKPAQNKSPAISRVIAGCSRQKKSGKPHTKPDYCWQGWTGSVNIKDPLLFEEVKYSMSQIANKILVTCALPYANGSIHLGHMLEHIRLIFGSVFSECAAKRFTSSAPTMLTAPRLCSRHNSRESPEEMIANMSVEHQKDFADFAISFDNYHSTHSEENRVLSENIYLALKRTVILKPDHFPAV